MFLNGKHDAVEHHHYHDAVSQRVWISNIKMLFFTFIFYFLLFIFIIIFIPNISSLSSSSSSSSSPLNLNIKYKMGIKMSDKILNWKRNLFFLILKFLAFWFWKFWNFDFLKFWIPNFQIKQPNNHYVNALSNWMNWFETKWFIWNLNEMKC